MSVFAALLKGTIEQTAAITRLRDSSKLLGVTDKLSSGVDKLTKMAKQEAKASQDEREKFHKALEDLVIQYKLTTKLLGSELGESNKALDQISEKILHRDKLSKDEGQQFESLLKQFSERVKELNKSNPNKSINTGKVISEYNSLLNDSKISLEIRKSVFQDLVKFINSQSSNLDNNLTNKISKFKSSDLNSSNIKDIAKVVTEVEAALNSKNVTESIASINKKLDSSLLETHEVHSLFSKVVGKSGQTFREAFKAAPGDYSVGNARKEIGSSALSALGLGEVDKFLNISGKADALAEKLFEKREDKQDVTNTKLDNINSTMNMVDDSIEEQTQLNRITKGQMEQMNFHLSNIETMNPVTSTKDSKDGKDGSRSMTDRLRELSSNARLPKSMIGKVGIGLGLAGGAVGLMGAISNAGERRNQSFFGQGEGEGGLMESRAANYTQATASGAMMGAAIGSIFPVVGTAIGGALGGLTGAASVFVTENKDKIGKFFSKIGDGFTWIFENVVTPYIGFVAKIFNGTKDAVVSVFNTYVKPAIDVVQSVFSALGSTIKAVWDWFSGLPGVSKAIDLAKAGGTWIKDKATKAASRVTEAVSAKYTEYKDAGQQALGQTGSAVQGAGHSLINASTSAGASVGGYTGSAISSVGSGVGSTVVGVGKGMTKLAMPNMTVAQALQNASRVVGVDIGTLYAMANQESGFNPNAKAGTSSASGLFQFLKGTWSEMVRKYGKQYGFSEQDKNDPTASAIAGALYIRDNQKILGTNDPTAVYAAHFLGPGGAKQLMRNLNTGKLAANDMPGPAAANRNIFYNKDGTARTYQEVYQVLANKVGNKASAYSMALGSSPIAGNMTAMSSTPASITPTSSVPSASSGTVSPTMQTVGNTQVAEAMTLNNSPSVNNGNRSSLVQQGNQSVVQDSSKSNVPVKVTQVDDFGIAFFNSALFG